MFRKIFHGGCLSKSSPRIAIHEPDLKPPRDALVQLYEWPSDSFMIQISIKKEFDMYAHNAELTNFLPDKCLQYHDRTDSFVRKFKYVSHRTSHDIMFNLYENYFHMTIEEFCESCRMPYWGHALNIVKLTAVNFLRV
jgi:hypothetical protein